MSNKDNFTELYNQIMSEEVIDKLKEMKAKESFTPYYYDAMEQYKSNEAAIKWINDKKIIMKNDK